MQQEEEIEVNFRLDQLGRTAPTTATTNHQDELSQPIRRYEPHSVMMELQVCPQHDTTKTDSTTTTTSNDGNHHEVVDWNNPLLDELLYDCEISDCGLMPRTFWVPCQDFGPRCSMEQMALDVFDHHVKRNQQQQDEGLCFDAKTSGAEWWVQIRPSPEKTGRYSMLDKNDNPENDDNNDVDMAKEGISFHWDKDEDLRILCGGNTYVHPHLSTVTYLTDIIAAPTLALNIRVNNLTGEWIIPDTCTNHSSKEDNDKVEGFLSWPKFGKHLSFDGRYLHAAPSDFMEPGEFQKQSEIPDDEKNNEALTESERKKLKRRRRRVTFLVNVWLNYKPFGVQPFPDSMINKLSGHQSSEPRVGIKFPTEEDGQQTATAKPDTSSMQIDASHVEIEANKARVASSDTPVPVQTFQWPLGDCSSEESIKADLPLDLVRQAKQGGSLHFSWKTGVQMNKTSSIVAEDKTESCKADADGEAQKTKRPRLAES